MPLTRFILNHLHLEYLNTLKFYFGDCGYGAIYRDGFTQNQSRVISRVRNLFTTDYHQLYCLGVALLNVRQAHPTFINALLTGVGSGLGFALVLVLFAAMRERFMSLMFPKAFRGSAIAMVTAGLMSLSFMGFAGLVKF
jgi:electron transport complex protein RnfA